MKEEYYITVKKYDCEYTLNSNQVLVLNDSRTLKKLFHLFLPSFFQLEMDFIMTPNF